MRSFFTDKPPSPVSTSTTAAASDEPASKRLHK
jgi:hypothetical protein